MLEPVDWPIKEGNLLIITGCLAAEQKNLSGAKGDLCNGFKSSQKLQISCKGDDTQQHLFQSDKLAECVLTTLLCSIPNQAFLLQ